MIEDASRDSTCEQVSATKYMFRLAAKGILLDGLRNFKLKFLEEINRNMAEAKVTKFTITHVYRLPVSIASASEASLRPLIKFPKQC
jgi:hypothetical protein